MVFLGYALLAAALPQPREFRPLERLAFSFGAGVVLLTLWMLALTWRGHPYGLALILGPLLVLAAALLLTPRGRRACLGDLQALQSPGPFHLQGWDWLFLGLLALMLLYAFLRASLYPMWAWDAIATWGCKAKIFYATRGVDLTCIEAHNYYPNLLPLLLSYLYFCLGRINDHLVQGLFPIWGALLLGLLYSLARRLGLSRTRALGLTAFLALNGTVFIVHLYIAYADLPLAFFTLGAAGLLYLWLADQAPPGSLALTALFLAGMAWCKYEGPPLAATLLLAAALTLAWLRPPGTWRRLLLLSLPLAGLVLGYLPWRLFAIHQNLADRRRPHPGLLSAPIRPGHLVSGRGPDSALLLRPPLARRAPGGHLCRPAPLDLPYPLPGPLYRRQPPGRHPGLRRGPHLRRRVPQLRPGHPGPPAPPPHPHRRPAPGPGAQGALPHPKIPDHAVGANLVFALDWRLGLKTLRGGPGEPYKKFPRPPLKLPSQLYICRAGRTRQIFLVAQACQPVLLTPASSYMARGSGGEGSCFLGPASPSSPAASGGWVALRGFAFLGFFLVSCATCTGCGER